MTGVRTSEGQVQGDLVIDAPGRTSPAFSWLPALGAAAPQMESSPCGHFDEDVALQERVEELLAQKFAEGPPRQGPSRTELVRVVTESVAQKSATSQCCPSRAVQTSGM